MEWIYQLMDLGLFLGFAIMYNAPANILTLMWCLDFL